MFGKRQESFKQFGFNNVIINDVSWFNSSLLLMIDLQIYIRYNQIRLEIIYKSNQRTSKGSWVWIDRVS